MRMKQPTIFMIYSQKWKADYTNHFIERRYITVDEFERLSEIQKEKCNEDGGIILNRKSFDDAGM